MAEDTLWPIAGRVTPSISEYLARERPDLLPRLGGAPPGVAHGTTILAMLYGSGVVMAGDRRATEGYNIAHRGIEKVFPTDDHSAVAISGAAGPAIELVRLFQLELEHYEKVDGDPLSLEGRANFLGRLIRDNLPAAMQGLVVLPLFAGFDLARGRGRIFLYDVTGGRYEETEYHAAGSGGTHARNTLKKVFRAAEEIDRDRGIRVAVEALADAAEEDAATAGPDPVHGIYPSVFVLSASGVERVADGEVEQVSRQVLADRTVERVPSDEGRPPAMGDTDS